MTLYECKGTLENRKLGLAYEIWKKGNLNQMYMENYPDTPEKACPELFPYKKTIAMPDFLKQKHYGRGGK